MRFNPRNWYWQSDDGRLFSSASASLVSDRDTAFSAWLDAGGIVTRWPVDDDGNQTDASLQEVLSPYGVIVATTLSTYQSLKRAEVKAACRDAIYAGAQSSALGSDHTYAMDDDSQKNYLAAVAIAGQDATADTWTRSFWHTQDGKNWSYTPHGKAQVLQLGLDIVGYTEAQQSRYADLLETIDAAETIADVALITWA